MKTSWLIVLVVLGLIWTNSLVTAKLFQYCAAPHGTVQTVVVTGCKDSDLFCKFKKGENVTIDLGFTPNNAASSVKVKVYGELGNVPIPFGVDPSEACGNYGLTCPLETGKTSRFSLTLPIKQIYPSISLTVRLELEDETKNDLACIKFKTRIIE